MSSYVQLDCHNPLFFRNYAVLYITNELLIRFEYPDLRFIPIQRQVNPHDRGNSVRHLTPEELIISAYIHQPKLASSRMSFPD